MNNKLIYFVILLMVLFITYFIFYKVNKSKISSKTPPSAIIPPGTVLPPGNVVPPGTAVPPGTVVPPDVPPGEIPIQPQPILPTNPLQKVIKGAPPGVDTSATVNAKITSFVSDCISKKGVINIDQKFNMNCLKYLDGTVLKTFEQSITNSQIPDYLSALYPAFNFKIGLDFTNFYNGLDFKYSPNLQRASPVESAVFYNLEYIEVCPLASNYYKSLNVDSWSGTWYFMGTGTGWFIPMKTCLFAYNSIHLLNLFDISDANFLNYASSDFKTFLGSKTTASVRQEANTPTSKIPYLNDSGKLYITQLAVQRGYRCIQLSNEWDGSKYERFYIDLIEATFSVQKCIQKNPFKISTNTNTENLWLDIFFAPGIPLVDPKYILDPDPPKSLGQRYGDFSFKTGCSKKRGVLNIADMLLTCQKIIKFGGTMNLLDTETSTIDWKSLPQSTELEKLQSYFSVVYGSPSVWKSKDLATLQDYWNRMEMRYKLPIFPTSPYKKYKPLNFGGSYGTQMVAFQEDGRPGEAVKYIEVVRQNVKNSYYETTNSFNGCYYYACRGSGLFLPTGKLVISKTKQTMAQTWGTTIPSCCIPEDIAIAKLATYRGYDTLMVVKYCGYTCPQVVEVVSLKDPITSLNSLIRTHPWDPILNEVANYDLTDAYSGPTLVDVKNCIITKQYEPGLGGNVCPL